MSDLKTNKFPKGYDVSIVKKSDVLKCIDDNILDKDIALELITQLEVDVANYLSKGEWTGIPYIGNIRKSAAGEAIKENSELLKEAADTLDKEKYILFRKQIAVDATKRHKYSRYFNYMLSRSVGHNYRLYNKIAAKYGKLYADIKFFCITNLTIMNACCVIYDYYGER